VALTGVDIGDRVRISVQIQVSGVDTDPTGLVFKWKEYGQDVATYTYGVDSEIVKDDTGNYHIDIDQTRSKTHQYVWEATGTAVGAEGSTITVKESAFYSQ
jgi:hypothetical protein